MYMSFVAILLAAIASMIIGSIWYGPLFGKMFMHEMGMDGWSSEKQAAMKKSMTATYIWQFVASLVMFFVLDGFMVAFQRVTVMSGLHIAFFAWLGFIVPLKLGDSLWGGKMTLFWLGAGNSLITILVGAVIIGAIK